MKLPNEVNIVEVGPRDGFQNIKEWIPTETKLKVINGLIDSNFKKIEVTSFVHPKAIEQMKDSKEIAKATLEYSNDIELIALVPNLRGAKDAWDAGIRNITYVISASEAHNKANVNRTIDESFDELSSLKKELPLMKVKLDIATAFGCPFEGDISIDQLVYVINKAMTIKVDEICICDTTGIANPLQLSNMLLAFNKLFPNFDFSLHLHDTRGMGLANVIVALENGVTEFETSIGGLGGCPFAPGAAGNTASEDLVHMLHSMGIKTGINLDKLLDTSKLVKSSIKQDLTGHLVNI